MALPALRCCRSICGVHAVPGRTAWRCATLPRLCTASSPPRVAYCRADVPGNGQDFVNRVERVTGLRVFWLRLSAKVWYSSARHAEVGLWHEWCYGTASCFQGAVFTNEDVPNCKVTLAVWLLAGYLAAEVAQVQAGATLGRECRWLVLVLVFDWPARPRTPGFLAKAGRRR